MRWRCWIVWAAAGAFWIICIVLTHMPNPPVVAPGGSDKLSHFAGYAGLGVAWYLSVWAWRPPWRMEYIRTLDKQRGGECFLCQAAAAKSPEEKRQRLVLWSTEQIVVVINKYPYSNGHILVSPIAHKAELEDLTDAEVAAMQTE